MASAVAMRRHSRLYGQRGAGGGIYKHPHGLVPLDWTLCLFDGPDLRLLSTRRNPQSTARI